MSAAAKPTRGLLVVIDGIDGSGKTTQHALLKERLAAENIPHALFDFPQYGRPSAYFVERYLNGAYGSLTEVGARQASLFYALDRFEAAPAIRSALAQGKVAVCNRFTAANMAYQGAKIADSGERAELLHWIDQLEHGTLNIPRPDLTIVLRVPAALGQQNVARKDQATRGYTDKTHDLHEADAEFLQRSAAVYNQLCAERPEEFAAVDCVRKDGAGMRGQGEIHQEIWNLALTKINT